MKKSLLLVVIIGFFTVITTTFAQYGFGTNSPDASAIIDMTASDKGLLIPRVALTGTTDATTVPSPATSLVVYNNAIVLGVNGVTPGYYYWDGTKWVRLFDNNTILPTSSLPTDLVYTGTSPASGDISGTYAAGFQIVSGAVTTAGISGGSLDDVLITNTTDNGTTWGKIANANVAASAEIEVSKLANGTAGQILTTDGTDVSWGTIGTAMADLSLGNGLVFSDNDPTYYDGSEAKVINIVLDGSTLANSGSGLKVNTSGITANEIATSAVETVEILNGTILPEDLSTSTANPWVLTANVDVSNGLDVTGALTVTTTSQLTGNITLDGTAGQTITQTAAYTAGDLTITSTNNDVVIEEVRFRRNSISSILNDTDLTLYGNGGGIVRVNDALTVLGATTLSGFTTSGIVLNSSSGLLSTGTALPDGITATTQLAGDNSTKVATTAYVNAAAGTLAGSKFLTYGTDGNLSAEEVLTAGNGVTLTEDTGTMTVAVKLDGSTLANSASGLKVAEDGITSTELADNAVGNAQLADDAVTVAEILGGAQYDVLLTNTTDNGTTWGKIANANVADAAGIVYSKLDFTDNIVAGDIATSAIETAEILNETIINEDISLTAEIAVSKLGDGDAYQVVATASDGSTVAWTTLAAANVSYSNSTSGLTATTVQAAIDELDSRDKALTQVNANYAAAATDGTIIVTAAAIVTLPTTGLYNGMKLTIKKAFSGAGAVSVASVAKVDGNASVSLTNWQSIVVQYDNTGATWWIIAQR